MKNMIDVSNGVNLEIPAYFAAAQHIGAPGIILIHEVWGLTDHIKEVADRLSQADYNVIAPDLISNTALESVLTPEFVKLFTDPGERLKHQTDFRAALTPMHSPEFAQQTIQKIDTCFRFLQHEANIHRIAVVGFCFGGTYVFKYASEQPELAAAVAYYGHADTSDAVVTKINCPILAFYGDQDKNLAPQVTALNAAMKTAGKNYTYKVYPGAGHAFFNDTNKHMYNKEAAKDSWDLTVSFLNQYTKS